MAWARIGSSAAWSATSAWWAASRPGTRRADSTGVTTDGRGGGRLGVGASASRPARPGVADAAGDQREQHRDGDGDGGRAAGHSDETTGRGRQAGGRPAGRRAAVRARGGWRQRACSHRRARACTARFDDG